METGEAYCPECDDWVECEEDSDACPYCGCGAEEDDK